MYMLSFYVPQAAAETVKQAVFSTGAGRIGDYDQCCWQTSGQGQFRPLAGSQPTIGEQDRLETLEELKIELVCSDDCISQAVASLVEAHPYEEVAYAVIRLENDRI